VALRGATGYSLRVRRAIGSAVISILAVSVSVAGCGGPQTRVVNGHTMVFEGERDRARLSVDGTPVRVTYDQVAGAYRAPGCDFGPAATLESLAEQVATTSPGSCQPLE
jgi:hypothetical protein